MAPRFPRFMKKHRRDIPTLVLTLVSVALLTVSALICLNALGPHGDPKPSVTDWISAVGQAVGAIGTAGALGLGAYTYFRQVRDQHRAQAAAISIYKFPNREGRRNRKIRLQLRNDSNLPIYGVSLVGTNRIGEYKDQSFRPALPAGEQMWVDITTAYGTSGYAMFTDSFGNSWKRYMNGDFEPHGKKPERWSQPGSKQAVIAAARAKRQSNDDHSPKAQDVSLASPRSGQE